MKEEKFFHHHDIGSSEICKAGMARIPLHMYQKLELAKHIVGAFGSSRPLVVTMLSEFGETTLDADMCSALQAAMQMAIFPLPSFSRKDLKKQDLVKASRATIKLTQVSISISTSFVPSWLMNMTSLASGGS